MDKSIRNMLSIPRVGTYMYYQADEESPTRFVEVTDVVEGRVYFNGDDGAGDCTLNGWQHWVLTEIFYIEEYAL